VIGAADGLLVVLHDHQRIAVPGELGQAGEQDAVVARCSPMVGSSST